MSTGKRVLIIGPGFIGWNVLDLLVAEGYSVTGFVRRKEHGDAVKASGATNVVLGDLDDKKLVTGETIKHDIVFHTATADHLPSVEAVLEGLRAKARNGEESVFIHTSGTSVLEDTSMVSSTSPSGAMGGLMHCCLLLMMLQGAYKSDKIYRDDKPEDIDAVPDSALHREIDLTITKAWKELAGTGKVKIAIMIPPTIFGCEATKSMSLSSTANIQCFRDTRQRHHTTPLLGSLRIKAWFRTCHWTGPSSGIEHPRPRPCSGVRDAPTLLGVRETIIREVDESILVLRSHRGQRTQLV